MKTKKNYLSYLFLALTLTLPFGLISCSDDDDENVGSKEDLIGTWQYIDFEYTLSAKGEELSEKEDFSSKKITLKFKADKTGILTDEYKNKTDFDWSYKGNKLKLMYEFEDDETFTVKTLNSNNLILEMKYKGKEEGISYTFNGIWKLKKINN